LGGCLDARLLRCVGRVLRRRLLSLLLLESRGWCWRCGRRSGGGDGFLLSFSFLTLYLLLLDDGVELVNVLLEFLKLLAISAGRRDYLHKVLKSRVRRCPCSKHLDYWVRIGLRRC
jgi:hypothetical protein